VIKKKSFWFISLISLLIVAVAVLFFYSNTIGARETQLKVRNVELTTELDYSSIINSFEDARVTKEGSLTTFEGYQTLDASIFEGLDNVSASDIESSVGCQVKYNFTYDSDTNIVTLSAVMENGEDFAIEEIYGSAFIDENGRLDAVMDFDGEFVLLSEMQNAGMIQNCGWFSNLFKTFVKVAIAVVAVAVCVATAGAGTAACIAIGAAVGAAESVATQLVETGTVNVGTLVTDTVLGAIPGGPAGKALAKGTAKAASNAAKSAAKTTAKTTAKKVTKSIVDKYSNKYNKEVIEYLQKEKVSPERLKQRVGSLANPDNKDWKVFDADGKKIVSKDDFALKGGNGTVRRASDGEEVADVIQGAVVFREKYVKHVMKMDTDITADISKNMPKFDNYLKDQLKNLNNTDKSLQEIRKYFKKQGKDIERLNAKDIKNYRDEKGLTWHECSDKRTIQLVDKEVHSVASGGVPHSGGRSEVKSGG